MAFHQNSEGKNPSYFNMGFHWFMTDCNRVYLNSRGQKGPSLSYIVIFLPIMDSDPYTGD